MQWKYIFLTEPKNRNRGSAEYLYCSYIMLYARDILRKQTLVSLKHSSKIPQTVGRIHTKTHYIILTINILVWKIKRRIL